MREALADDRLLGTMMQGPSWDVWKALLIASRGETLTEAEMALYGARTGRDAAPDEPLDELWLVAGRRSGKTVSAAVLSMYLAALCDWSDVLSRGERGVMLFLAQSQRTAKVAFRYADAAFQDIPAIRKLVRGRTQETIELKNGVDLEIRPASFRGLRGLTAIGVVGDEIAYWHSDETSANPDTEILAAVRPALATTGGPLIAISSPYARKGELWEAYRRHYGPAGDKRIVVAQGRSRDFNQTLPEKVVARALERDPDKAKSEYLAEFRDDISTFIGHDTVRRLVAAGVHEREPEETRSYFAFADPSGGVGDSMTLGIAHWQDDKAVLDLVREWRPPFNPDEVVGQACAVLRKYNLASVTGDRFGAEWVSTAFGRWGVNYMPSERNKSEVYLEALPLLTGGTALLLDDEKLIRQITGLERRTTRLGRDIVDHAPREHDDVANAALGALELASGGREDEKWERNWRKAESQIDRSWVY